MAHIEPLDATTDAAQLQGLAGVLAGAEQAMGFVPNSMLTMAHMPQLTMAFSMLAGVVFGADLKQLMALHQPNVPADSRAEEALSPDLVQLIAYSVSVSAGCRYCQAHTSHNAHRFGISEEKLHDILNYADSPHFSAAEKALVGAALAAGQVPNETSEAHFAALGESFTTRQIVQIVAVISLFGFLNRWNDTMATQLEKTPVEFAQRVLSADGWLPGKHRTGNEG
jgi:AhpD family alkylhydroperoxidase